MTKTFCDRCNKLMGEEIRISDGTDPVPPVVIREGFIDLCFSCQDDLYKVVNNFLKSEVK